MKALWTSLLPELRHFPPAERDAALLHARATPLQAAELLGTVLAVIVVAALTRHALPDAPAASRLLAMLLDLALALPLLAAAAGAFHLRRLRRGLREQLQRRGRA